MRSLRELLGRGRKPWNWPRVWASEGVEGGFCRPRGRGILEARAYVRAGGGPGVFMSGRKSALRVDHSTASCRGNDYEVINLECPGGISPVRSGRLGGGEHPRVWGAAGQGRGQGG